MTGGCGSPDPDPFHGWVDAYPICIGNLNVLQQHMGFARGEQNLGIFLKTIPIGVLVVDGTGRIQSSNQAREDIWGGVVPTTDIAEHTENDGWWPDTGIPLRPEEWPIQRAIKNGETTLGMMVDIKRPDSSMATVLISTAPMKDETGRILGAIATMQDFTEHRRMEQRIVETKEKLELYLDIMTHDVNNLNSAVRGNLELFRTKERSDARGRVYLDNAERILDNVSTLIENINKLLLVESGESAHRSFDLSEVLEEAVSSGLRTPGRKVSVELWTPSGLMVEANDLVRDVFSNLIQNAIKHTSDPVEVTVRAERTLFNGKGFCRVEVEDKGPGIPDEMKMRIFDRFERGSTRSNGKGLGLYLVKKITEGFGGTVWVEDRVTVDGRKGARFVVNLPLADREGELT